MTGSGRGIWRREWRGLWAAHAFFAALTLVSLRHFFVEGDHIWTGETDRFSWNMRLRSRVCLHEVASSPNGPWSPLTAYDLTERQRMAIDDPYVLHYYAKRVLCPRGGKVHARVNCRASSSLPALLVDPAVDLCGVDYKILSHNAWITPRPGAWDPDYRTKFRSNKDILNVEDLRPDEEEPHERADTNDS